MNVSNARYALTLLFAALLLTAGCSGSGSGSDDKMGRISLGVSDHPMHDAAKVCIAFTEVELKPKDGPALMADKLTGAADFLNVNLLEFQDMNAAPLLMDFELSAGEYNWIRLGVNAVLGGMGGFDDDLGEYDMNPMGPCVGDESYLMMKGPDEETPGEIHNLYMPSGAENGLKLHSNIVVPDVGTANFTAEFDLLKSVAYPGGLAPDAVIRPTIRLVNNLEVGALTGVVDDTLVIDGCAPTVFIFQDDGLDVALDAANSLTSAMVNEQINDTDMIEYHYTIGFLPGGDYEIAFSCDDGVNLNPPNGKPATVVEGDVVEVGLP